MHGQQNIKIHSAVLHIYLKIATIKNKAFSNMSLKTARQKNGLSKCQRLKH